MTGVPGPFTPSVVCMTADAMPSCCIDQQLSPEGLSIDFSKIPSA